MHCTVGDTKQAVDSQHQMSRMHSNVKVMGRQESSIKAARQTPVGLQSVLAEDDKQTIYLSCLLGAITALVHIAAAIITMHVLRRHRIDTTGYPR